MPYYLLQATYTPEAWTKLVKNPQDRAEAIRPVIEGLGGKVIAGFLAFGEYDTVAFAEMPNNVSAAAFSMAAAAGGGLKVVKTTPLLTTQEGVEAMQKAAATAYQPPA